MAREKVGMGIEVPDLKKTLATLNKLPGEATVAMRDASQQIAADEADRLRSAGMSSGDKQSKLVAGVIRAKRDRVPSIAAGGTKKVAPSRKIYRSTTNRTKTGRGKLVKPSAGDIFFGAEFGGRRRKTTQQFRPHRGRKGYWFWPQLRADEARMISAYDEAVTDVLGREWGD